VCVCVWRELRLSLVLTTLQPYNTSIHPSREPSVVPTSSLAGASMSGGSGTSRQHWPLGETQALLNVWAEHSVQRQMEGLSRNEEVIQYMVAELAKLGIRRTSTQVREKLKKLRQQYKAVKSREQTKSFPFFELMDSVLGDKVAPHHLGHTDHTAGHLLPFYFYYAVR